MSLVARHLEEAGIATVIVGSAQDIVETAGVPRFVFVDYPLGNPLGRPGNTQEQRHSVEAALELVTVAVAPRMTRRLGLDWGSDEWRAIYMHVGDDNRAELARLGDERRTKAGRSQAEGIGRCCGERTWLVTKSRCRRPF